MGNNTMGTFARALFFLSCAVVFGCSGKAKDDGGGPGTSGDGDGDGDQGEPAICEDNDDCSDDTFCNGEERCNPDHEDADAFGCIEAADEPCSDGNSCNEEDESCGCENPDADGDGADSVACGGDDCDDNDSNRYFGNEEVCDPDHHDEDCDPTTFGFRDQDGDGDPDDQCCNEDESGDLICGTDCNDNRANQHSFNTEVCDDVDNDCDGLVDETIDGDEDDGLKTVFTIDADGDGWGSDADDADTVFACDAPEGYVESATDCDDDDNQRSPSATEVCDDVDNDCDGLTDESIDGDEDDGLKFTFTIDADGDGFGSNADDAETVLACTAPPGYVTSTSDCDDDAADVSPGAFDSCTDDIDNDCSGEVNDPIGGCDCTGNISQSCAVPGGEGGPGLVGLCATSSRTCVNGEWDDCGIMPNSQSEVCDATGVDEDCDGYVNNFPGSNVNDSMKVPYYRDRDGDGYPDLSTSQVFCANLEPAGWTTDANPEDCVDELLSINPLSGDINPGETEVCNGRDDNCDNIVDGLTSDGDLELTFYHDDDGDGQGGTDTTTTACTNPGAGWYATAQDCNDNDATIYLGAQESCDGVDEDCDGLADVDDPHATNNCDVTGQIQSAVCAVNQCMVDECTGTYLDCDLEYDCETDGSSDIDHCGECGNSCSLACSDSSCDEIESLDLGEVHSCGVSESGLAVCWGRNDEGRIGDGSTSQKPQPSDVANITSFVAVSGGSAHTCGVAGESDTLYCWGSDGNGRLGSTTTSTSSSVPLPVAGVSGGTMTQVTSVDAGVAHTCAVYGGGNVACWGNGGSGRLADGDATAHNTVTAVQASRGPSYEFMTGGEKIVAGDSHSCLLRTNGGVECWGSNSDGQIGSGADTATFPTFDSSRDVTGLSNVTDLCAGWYHSCAVMAGNVHCWGANAHGQLGVSGGSVNTPQQIPDLSNVVELACGARFTCARLSNGTVQCWGSNASGERGDGNSTSTHERTTVSITQVQRLGAGRNHACALRTSGDVRCWGRNNEGQLGVGAASTGSNSTPVKVFPLD